VGQPRPSATGTAAAILAPRRRRGSSRAATPGSYGQLPDPRTTRSGQTVAEPKSRKLPEFNGTWSRRPFTTTQRGFRHNSTREAQATTVGSRQIDKPIAKHFLCGVRTTSERLLRATCTRRPCAVPRRSRLLIRQWWWQAASPVWRLRPLRTLQLRRRTTAWRTRRRTRWPAERAAHALSFFVHIAMAHLEL
jgi:hypothetical protein